MLSIILGFALLSAVQDVPPLAGTLPPLPAARSGPGANGDRSRGRLFISPMGEPFRGPDPVRAWFDRADADHDGALTLAEFVADADRLFIVLDRGKDGEIDPDDIDYYETAIVPEIRTSGDSGGAGPSAGREGGRSGGGRRGGGGGGRRFGGEAGGGATGAQPQRYGDVRRGAARFGFFDYPEPITVADANLNRGVDSEEFRAAARDRFATLDKNHDGRITRGELPPLPSPGAGSRAGRSFGAGRGGRRPDGAGATSPDDRDTSGQ